MKGTSNGTALIEARLVAQPDKEKSAIKTKVRILAELTPWPEKQLSSAHTGTKYMLALFSLRRCLLRCARGATWAVPTRPYYSLVQ
ncbi:hypothetical protein J3E68DRAFT_400555 [Trichoderma sp. SZMC 28012]